MSAQRRAWLGALATGWLLAGAAGQVRAQGNMEIQVYGAALVPPGATMLELHSNFTLSGERATVDGILPTRHALHETLEITHGFTSWLEVGVYAFNSLQSDGGYHFVGSHLRPRVAVPESWHWPVGLSLSQEIGWQRRGFDAATWSWEVRPIVDRRQGRLYVALNPVLARALRGPATAGGVHFAPNAMVTWDLTPWLTPGLEYYGDLGPVSGFSPAREQQQAIAPAFNLNLAPDWECNLGLVYGLTPATDRALLKLIVGWRVGAKH
jgi:hypothetical protein